MSINLIALFDAYPVKVWSNNTTFTYFIIYIKAAVLSYNYLEKSYILNVVCC